MLVSRRLKRKENGTDVLPSLAKWIGYPKDTNRVIRFEKNFVVEGDLRGATLFVCGLGFFDATLDGKRLDEEYFKPYYTDYAKRDLTKNAGLLIGNKQTVYGYVYDIEGLSAGEHRLEITVGSGFFQNEDRPEEPYVSYGEKRAIFELSLSYGEKTERIFSDENTKVKRLHATSELYNGDFVDFSKEEEENVLASVLPPLDGEWKISDGLGDIVGEKFAPVSTTKRGKSIVYDFGVNHSGVVTMKIKGQKGRKVTLKFAELLNKDGSLNMATSRWECQDEKDNLHRIDQVGEYVLSGGMDELKPLFSWHCYRYVEVCEADGLEIQDAQSLYIHSALQENGKFACSEKLFEEIHEKTRRTILNNAHAGLLSDCPHREKRPYTGDGQVIAETMLYDLDSESFFSKWLDDIIFAQTENGFIPYTAPYMGGGGGYSWSNAIAVVPDWLYRFSGKKEYIERAYAPLKKWLGYYEEHAKENIVTESDQPWCLSDWLAPEITRFNVPFMNTLCYYKAAETAEWFAEILGKDEDKQAYGELKEKIATAINARFFDEEKVRYCNGIQGENVLPLAYGIVPKKHRERLREKVRAFYDLHGHFDTGIVATPILLNYLTEDGMADIAFRMMTQVDYPSYSFLLDNETTLSEHWSKYWPDYYINNSDVLVKGGGELSHCHPMFGSVVAWLYKRVAGIDLTEIYKGKIHFQPTFTKELKNASAEVETRFGTSSIAWARTEKGDVVAKISVPHGATGVFVLDKEEITAVNENGDYASVEIVDGKKTVLLPHGNWKVVAYE